MTNPGPGADGSSGGGGAQQVFRGTVMLATSRILDRASTFVIALLIASRLGASGLGSFSTAIALYQVFSLAGEAGTTSFLIREVSRDKSRTGTYVVHLSVVALFVSVFLIAALEAIVPHLGYSAATRTSASIIVVAIAGTVLNSIQESAFVAHGRTEFEALATLFSSVAFIAIGVTLLENGHGVPSLMWTYVGCEYAVTVGYFLLISRYIARLRVRFRLRFALGLVRQMKAFIASSALAAVFARPEVVILSLLASATQVGYYGAAIRIAELPTFVPEVFMANVFTLLSRAFDHDKDRFRDIQAKAIRSMLAFSLPVGALLLALAPSIVVTLFGSQFHPAVTLLRILSFNIVSVSLMTVLWRSLAARHRQDLNLRVQIEMIGVRLGAGIALIAPLAALGAAITAAVGWAVWAALLALAVARVGSPAPIVGPGWRLALAAAVAGGAAWALASLGAVWLGWLVGVAVYVPAAVLLGAVSADDRELLGRLRPRALARVNDAAGPPA